MMPTQGAGQAGQAGQDKDDIIVLSYPARMSRFPSRLCRKPCASSAWGRLNANLSTVRIAQAYPGVAHLLVMHHRVVDLDVEAEPLHRQRADRREQGV